MAVAPVKNVPKNPYGSLGPSPTTVKKITPPTAWNPPTGGWGSATQANNLNTIPGNTLKYDVPGVASNPSAPFVAPPQGPAAVASTPGYWNKPDYAALLAGDWEPEQAAIAGQKQQGEAETAFQLALRRAFVDYGGSADKLDEKFRKYIDDPTIEAAKANKFSTMAQNLQAQTKALANQRAQLAARGMTRSGANTAITKRALDARELADYTAGRSFTGGAEEGLSGLAKTGMEIANAIAAAKARAAARIAEENPQTWVPGTGGGYEGASAYEDVPAAAPPAAAAAAPWGGVSWGGTSGIKTKAQLQSKLGYNQTLAQWARDHPAAWAKLT